MPGRVDRCHEMILMQAQPREAVIAAIPLRILVGQWRAFDAGDAADPACQRVIAEIVGAQAAALLAERIKMSAQAEAQCGGGGIGRNRKREGRSTHVISLATGFGLA